MTSYRANDSKGDSELLEILKTSAARIGYSPEALIAAGEAAAEFQRHAIIPDIGPHPKTIDAVALPGELLAVLPLWVAQLIPPGSSLERLHWPDGSFTIRLMSPRGRTLAAKFIRAQEERLV